MIRNGWGMCVVCCLVLGCLGGCSSDSDDVVSPQGQVEAQQSVEQRACALADDVVAVSDEADDDERVRCLSGEIVMLARSLDEAGLALAADIIAAALPDEQAAARLLAERILEIVRLGVLHDNTEAERILAAAQDAVGDGPWSGAGDAPEAVSLARVVVNSAQDGSPEAVDGLADNLAGLLVDLDTDGVVLAEDIIAVVFPDETSPARKLAGEITNVVRWGILNDTAKVAAVLRFVGDVGELGDEAVCGDAASDHLAQAFVDLVRDVRLADLQLAKAIVELSVPGESLEALAMAVCDTVEWGVLFDVNVAQALLDMLGANG